MSRKIKKTKENVFHVGFEVGLLLKGIDGLLEIIGGVCLLFLNPDRLNWLTRLLTQHELSEDPRDMVANLLVTLSGRFSIGGEENGGFIR
ncbi:hypothetical protein SDC9_71197 [bioreactor metagenome]|uniref:Uncharacterized protein n=1 Tax=bioreactor metagenome TaxID=1076179 RepID=A0A644YDW3_9ZZZZ